MRTLKKRSIEAMMAAKSEIPAAANNFVKRGGQVLDHAVDLEWLTANPARLVKLYEYDSEGIYPWSKPDTAQLYRTHKVVGDAHDAMPMMLYTAAAKVDAVKLGPFSVKATDNAACLIYVARKHSTVRPG